VYLPLLATVIPEWVRAIKRRALQRPAGTPAPRKVLVIVSGAGQPRDEKANPADNSTEGTGRIIERFVRLVHPEIEVVHIPSAYGIFRYDDNVRFVKEQVLPVLEAKRAEVVASHDDQWAQNLKVTVCLADGAPARISALHAAMRSYRPDYLHVWRTKTFWDTGMLSEEDVEPHTFKKLEMRPAVHRLQLTSAEEKGLVDEMVQYKRQFEAVRDSNTHELGTFWLRKTGKAVLAVLLTKSPLGELTFWRGMNVEVSMPTGTLCAERNAIGNALAGDHSVHRRDMLAVAVLSVTLSPPKHEVTDQALERTTSPDDEVALNPLDPCGACMEWLRKIAEVNPDFKVLTFTSTSCEKVFITPIGDYG
jgi:cytidine deaminase